MNSIVQTSTAASPRGAYAQAIRHGNTLYLAGQIGVRGADDGLASGLEAQIVQAIENMRNILAAEGGGLSDLVTVTCYITDKEDFPVFNAVYQRCFGSARLPARTTVVVKELPLGALFEATGIAGFASVSPTA